ncbi:MAG: AMIN domain-containing protein [Terriglobales bacterium]
MNSLPKIAWISFLASAFVFSSSSTATAQTAQVRHVGVRKSGGVLQIEIETTRRVVPLTQVVTDPDRLVIDFADAIPGPALRTVAVNDGEVKAVRVGRVTANPPVTRIVVDLKSPQPFQLFPSSKSVIVKVGDGNTAVAATPKAAEAVTEEPAAVTAEPAAVTAPAPTPAPPSASVQVASVTPALKTRPATLRAASAVQAPAIPTPAISVTRTPMVGGPSAQIRHVAMLKSGGATEIEIETSQRVEPSVQAITGPDRLVIDFPQSTPGPQLRALAVNQGEVKGVRVALLSAKPPVTRVVLDLKSAQAYQVFPSAKSVIVKLPDSMGNGPGALSSPQIAAVPPTPPPAPKKVDITFQDGRLSVTSNKASLAEVLDELRTKTGADIVVPPGAEQEVVAVVLGPSSPRDVISRLLDGSRYNFIIVGTDQDANQVERVILSPKNPGNMTTESRAPISDSVPVAQMEGPDRSSGAPPPPPAPPPPTEDVQPQGDSAPPDTTPQPGDPQAAPN